MPEPASRPPHQASEERTLSSSAAREPAGVQPSSLVSRRQISNSLTLSPMFGQRVDGMLARSSGHTYCVDGGAMCTGYSCECAHPERPEPSALTYSWKAILFRILLVDPNSAISAGTRAALAGAGHRVAGVSTFEEATLQLALDCPDLLITAVRLGAFNGMHLLLRFRAEHPDVPVVVIGAPGDLTPDMRRHATRSLSPRSTGSRSSIGVRSAGRSHASRSTQPPPVAAEAYRAARHHPLARRTGRRAQLWRAAAGNDGGAGHGGAPIEIGLPSLGLQVKAVPRWSKPVEEGGSWWCGAEIALSGTEATSVAPHRRRSALSRDQLRSRSQSPVFGRLLSAVPRRRSQPDLEPSGADPALIARKSD